VSAENLLLTNHTGLYRIKMCIEFFCRWSFVLYMYLTVRKSSHKNAKKQHILATQLNPRVNPVVVHLCAITLDIRQKYNVLYNQHYNIIFCWIPSHVGIKGNTKADKLAGDILVSSTQVIPIPSSELLLLFGTTSVPNGKLLWIPSQTINCTKYLPNFTICTIAPVV